MKYMIYMEKENDVWNKYFKEDSDTSSTRDKISELTSIFKILIWITLNIM